MSCFASPLPTPSAESSSGMESGNPKNAYKEPELQSYQSYAEKRQNSFSSMSSSNSRARTLVGSPDMKVGSFTEQMTHGGYYGNGSGPPSYRSNTPRMYSVHPPSTPSERTTSRSIHSPITVSPLPTNSFGSPGPDNYGYGYDGSRQFPLPPKRTLTGSLNKLEIPPSTPYTPSVTRWQLTDAPTGHPAAVLHTSPQTEYLTVPKTPIVMKLAVPANFPNRHNTASPGTQSIHSMAGSLHLPDRAGAMLNPSPPPPSSPLSSPANGIPTRPKLVARVAVPAYPGGFGTPGEVQRYGPIFNEHFAGRRDLADAHVNAAPHQAASRELWRQTVLLAATS